MWKWAHRRKGRKWSTQTAVNIQTTPRLSMFNNLKVQSVILILYTFCQIQQIAPHGPLAVHSVFALKRQTVFVQSLLCKWKHTWWLRPYTRSDNPSQSTQSLRSTGRSGVIWLTVQLKISTTFPWNQNQIADSAFEQFTKNNSFCTVGRMLKVTFSSDILKLS